MYKKAVYNIYLICILLIWNTSYGITIPVDNLFSSKELYNGLNNKFNPSPNIFSLSIKLVNTDTDNKQLYLNIINPAIDTIYIIENKDTTVLGDYQSFTERKFKHNNHVYPFLLKGKEKKEIILIIKKQHQYTNFRITLTSENTFIKTTNHDNFFIGIFFGLLFTYMLLLICLYIFSKSKFYLKYFTINIFTILVYLHFTGIGNQYIWFYSATIQNYIIFFIVCGYLISHIYFVRTFFSSELNLNTVRSLLIILSTLMAVIIIAYLFDFYYPILYYLKKDSLYYSLNGIFTGYGIYILIISIYSYIKTGRRENIWIISGTILHITNWLIFINNNYGIIEALNFIANSKLFYSHFFIAPVNFVLTIIEIVMVSVFLATNYYKSIHDNNISAKKLSALQKKNIRSFISGQEDERNRISTNVTDIILKDINALKETITGLKVKNDTRNILPTVLIDLEKTIQDIKDISSNYIAYELQKMSIQDIIITATNSINEPVNKEFKLSNNTEIIYLNQNATINLYRILQEVSNNIIKHSNANHVNIEAKADEKNLELIIQDNGIGINNNTSNSGIGLINIESRVNLLNGTITITSAKNRGTTFSLLIPLKINR